MLKKHFPIGWMYVAHDFLNDWFSLISLTTGLKVRCILPNMEDGKQIAFIQMKISFCTVKFISPVRYQLEL